MTQIEVIKPEDRATRQLAQFNLDVAHYQAQIDAIIVRSVDDKTQMKQAGDLRKKIQKIRTGAENVKKALKKDSNEYNKAVDSIWNKIKQTAQDLEQQLSAKEKFAELKEAERLEKIRAERTEALTAITDEWDVTIPENIATLSEQDFEDLLEGRKARHTLMLEENRKLQERQQEEELERETLRQENELLKKQVEESKVAPPEEKLLHQYGITTEYGIRFSPTKGKIIAVLADSFIDITTSPIGVGSTQLEAVANLAKNCYSHQQDNIAGWID
jgi:hypothetical protein